MIDAILVLNVGSSSLKFAVYPQIDTTSPALLRGKIAGIGSAPVFSAHDAARIAVPQSSFPPLDRAVALDDVIPKLLDWLKTYQGGFTIVAAGHRVVHGGRDLKGPARVTDVLLAELDALVPLAPMHQPHSLTAIRSIAEQTPKMPQVACFDTSFHRTQNRLAQLFALPRALSDEGILRYGFHGLSYEYIASVLPAHLGDRARGRVIVAHLGNGASMCAMTNARSVANSMGFTALDGLMMGRRCGTLDAGVVLYLLEEKGMTPQEVSTLLYRNSGLLGVSGISSDMAVLQASEAPEAQEAIDLYCYRAAGELAALAAANGGLDALVFTAGIGENSALIRKRICDRLLWMGVVLNLAENDGNATRISSINSTIDVLVIPTDEESIIARTMQLLTPAAAVV